MILLPLYWLLFQLSPDQKPSQAEMMVFMILSAAWASGQGMHLSANSIGHLLGDMKESDVYALTYFFDEDLSHYIWHLGVVGLSAVIIFRQWQYPFWGESAGLVFVVVGGLLYGLTYFATIIEAGTVPLGVPFAVIITVVSLIWGRESIRQKPLLTYFLVAYFLAAILFLGWAIYWGGLPQFSEVGLIT